MMTQEEALEAGAVDLNGDGCLHLRDGGGRNGVKSYIEVYVPPKVAAERLAAHEAALAAEGGG